MDQKTIKQGVEQVVNELYNQHGEVRPSILIEAAKPKTSPAHDGFEWDNKKAGNEYRLIQARNWIRRVQVVVEDRPEVMIHVPQIRVEGEEVESEGYYKPVSVLVRDEYRAALDETLSRLNAAKASFEHLKQASKGKPEKAPALKRADKGFDMVESALSAA
jgi:hypothetical protein